MECSLNSMEVVDNSLGSRCDKFIRENSWAELNNYFKYYYKGIAINKERHDVLTSDINCLLSILDIVNSKFSWYNSLEVPFPELLAETLKILRVLVTDINVANYLIDNNHFYNTISLLMTCIFTKKNGQESYTKYLFQLIINFIIAGSQEKENIRTEISTHFLNHLKFYFKERLGFGYEISAVMYNLFLNRSITDLEIIDSVITNLENKESDNEYLDFLMEQITSEDYFWRRYTSLPMKSRVLALQYVYELLVAPNRQLRRNFRLTSIECLVYLFNDSSNIVFQVTNQDCLDSSQEVSYVLQILSVLSGSENYLTYLQGCHDLLINAGVLLINIHRLGKTSDVFKPIQKLSEIQNPSREIWDNPVFGFKASLIRLIGNLCWRNKRMQDLSRTAELIPVILDCCNIDAKNPFIMQWVILAIRNICENNVENQEIIAGLTQQGMVNSQVLQEFGISSGTEEILNQRFANLNLHSSNKSYIG